MNKNVSVKEINVIIRIASLIIAIIGLFVLIQSAGLGNDAANIYLINQSMDTGSYVEIKKGYISSYRYLGSILLLVGILTVLRKWE
ncbi:hypothetical protein [Paenibacillus sp. SI8]|uniref:hypothetical protein n=1 Tax=unclassified Paenibacillus TaxID=185978 RepID=UPI003466325E